MDVIGLFGGMLFWGTVILLWLRYLKKGKPSKPVRYVGTLFCVGLPLFIAVCMAKFFVIDEGLVAAVKAKDVGQVKTYLALGANPNMFDDYDNPPLAQAAGEGQEQIVRLLLAHGADLYEVGVGGPPWNGVTALTAAEEHGHKNIVKILKRAGADH
jgi:ankyrin repeat protein